MLAAWGLMLFVIIYIRLVLDAWSLELGAWSLELPTDPAGELEACRLKLGASFFQLSFLSSTSGFDRYVS